jgi:hypothetical protein
MHRGEIEKLTPQYRPTLARDGYVLVKWELADVQAGGLT